MKASQREAELQNIIKTLESKIHALKGEIQLNKNAQLQDISRAVDREKDIITQKDKSIAFLNEEVTRIKKQCEKEIGMKDHHHSQTYKSAETDLNKYKAKCEELQQAINKSKEIYENKIREKQMEVQQCMIKYQSLQRQKKAILEEVQKMNKYYTSSVHKYPQRQETLLWVDKLIEFMSKTSNAIAIESRERELALTSITRYLKEEITHIGKQYEKNDQSRSSEKAKFLQEMQKLIGQANKDFQDTLAKNNEFWEAITKAKIKEDHEKVYALQSKLVNMQQLHKKQVESLNEALSNLQRQKRLLLSSCQDLNNLYELREKVNREEVQFLKRSIQQLAEHQEIRETQFEEEIKKCGEKIEHLTTRFYEKLELPIQAVHNRIRHEVETFRKQFEGFYSNSFLQNQMQQFQNHIVEYLMNLNSNRTERQQLRQCVQNTLNIMQILQTNDKIVDHSIVKEGSDKRMAYSSISNYQSINDHSNKTNYELATLKRHLEKLKQYCKQLESKAVDKQSSIFNLKIIELATENQILKEKCQNFQKMIKENAYNTKSLAQNKAARLNTSLLQKIIDNSEVIITFTEREGQYIQKMSKCISSLNSIVISPIQMFDGLINQVKNITIHPQPKLEIKSSAEIPNDFQEKRILYKQILSKKHQVSSTLNKSIAQLSKLMRQLISKTQITKLQKTSNQQERNQTQRVKPQQSKILLEKKIREVQTQRIKNRQEMLSRLKILDDKFKIIEQKTIKKASFPFTKFEESICKRIQELIQAFNTKEKLKDVGKITEQALTDVKSKLKECFVQNQGLIKEMQTLRNVKQIFKNQG